MHDEASAALELGAIRAALGARVRTPLGRAQTERLSPLASAPEARARLSAVDEALGLLNLAEDPPVSGAEDVHAALEMAEKELVLEPAQLRAAARTMQAGTNVMRHLQNHEERAPSLFGLAAGLEGRAQEAREIERCFESDGSLADSASPELGPLRARVRGLEGSIRAKLGELLTESKLQDKLQESYFTIRNERHVLPIKASFKNEVKGIVHDASGSGQTVFIEPQLLVDLGNRLTIARSETREEELRILSRLTILVAEEAEMIRRMMEVVAELDFLSGCARLAIDLKALPIAVDGAPGFSLKRARHPQLVLQSLAPEPEQQEGQPPPPPRPAVVVGNDFALEEGQRVLIITGPNTGGKTVAMKTIGLFALMARCGLHLPCEEGSRIGWYPRLDVAIGDMQSIASNLSTFAAHVKALTGILRRAGEGSLVLIDEIASDTDPTQGQALAQAVLEQLAEAGAHAIVTTHFERLKAVPFVDERFRNAGVGFDAAALRPTYHVTLDVPQGSSGFDIAQSLGLPGAIVERARSLIGEGAQELEALIKEVERRSQGLEQARIELAEARAKIEEERAAVEREREQLKATQERLRQGARQELLADIAAEREEIKKMVARLQAATAEASASEAMRAANQLADQLGKREKAAREQLAEPPPVAAPSRELKAGPKVGDWVHVPRFGRDGDVVAIDGKMLHVALGNMRVRVSAKEVERARKSRSRRASSRPAPKEFDKKSEAKLPTLIVEEIDVRGASVDEALARVQTFLDYHFNSATTHVRIIHGHGTGALREALRDELRRSGYVKTMRPGAPEEGGDGATMIELG